MRCCSRQQQTTPDSPLIIGQADGSTPRLVQALVSLPGLPAQQWAWVSGSDVTVYIEANKVQESP